MEITWMYVTFIVNIFGMVDIRGAFKF